MIPVRAHSEDDQRQGAARQAAGGLFRRRIRRRAWRTCGRPRLHESLDEDPLVAELEQICREVAKDRKIGADDNLFEVGVSSLTLTEVVLAIDEKYPGKLDISDLFDYPTLREIAAFLQRDT